MVKDKFEDRVDRASGKAKEWAGRTTGNARLQREGRLQAGLAGAKITVRDTVKKLMAAVQQRRR